MLLPVQDGLDRVNCPYSYGYSIILLTLLVKVATFPLTKQQASLYLFHPFFLFYPSRSPSSSQAFFIIFFILFSVFLF